MRKTIGKKCQNGTEPLSMATNGNGSEMNNGDSICLTNVRGKNIIMMIKVSGHDDSGKVGDGNGGKIGNVSLLPPSSFKELLSNLL